MSCILCDCVESELSKVSGNWWKERVPEEISWAAEESHHPMPRLYGPIALQDFLRIHVGAELVIETLSEHYPAAPAKGHHC